MVANSKVIKKAECFYDTYERGADKINTHYCPGCGHGNLHKLIAEALDDFGVADRTIFTWPVGCSVFGFYYFKSGNFQCAHGRAPAVATGVRRARPDSIVLTYQGDGDLAAIGGDEILHAANRGENITCFFVNNAIYGMTGGQMAPTSLIGQKTSTSPYGRNPYNEGYPIRACELISTLEMPAYVERVALTDSKNIQKTRSAVRKAIKCQIDRKGFSFVEVLSPCPTNWKIKPSESHKYIMEEMTKVFPLAVFKDVIEARAPFPFAKKEYTAKEILAGLDLNEDSKGTHEKKKWTKTDPCPAIKIAGFGGQGVLLLGYLIAQTGLIEGYNVSWLPSYGPEMRGGTANCSVNVSDQRIGSPLVTDPTVLIAMNRPSMERFESDIVPQGMLFYDSTIIDITPKRTDIKNYPIPASKLADELGYSRAANIVLGGAYLAASQALSLESFEASLPKYIKKADLIPINKKALKAGFEYVKKNLDR